MEFQNRPFKTSGLKKNQVEQSSAIRCDIWQYGSDDDNLTVTFISGSNAQNLSI